MIVSIMIVRPRANKDADLTLPFDDYAKKNKVPMVVVTLGENGSIPYDGKTFYKGNIIETKIINTVEAGFILLRVYVWRI